MSSTSNNTVIVDDSNTNLIQYVNGADFSSSDWSHDTVGDDADALDDTLSPVAGPASFSFTFTGTSVQVVGSTIFGTPNDSLCLVSTYTLAGTQYPATNSFNQDEGANSVTYFQSPVLESNTYELAVVITQADDSCPYVLDFISYTVSASSTVPPPPASTTPSTTISPTSSSSSSSEFGMGHHQSSMHHSSGQSKVLIGILAGVLGGLGIILVGLAIFLFLRRRKRARDAFRPQPFDGGLSTHMRGPSATTIATFQAGIQSPTSTSVHQGNTKLVPNRPPASHTSPYTARTISGVDDILCMTDSGSQVESRWHTRSTIESQHPDTEPLPTASTPNLLKSTSVVHTDSGARYSGAAPSDVAVMDVPPMYSSE